MTASYLCPKCECYYDSAFHYHSCGAIAEHRTERDTLTEGDIVPEPKHTTPPRWMARRKPKTSTLDLGLAALAGAGATLVAVGLLLPVYGPRTLTIEPCTEDGVTLYDGSCGHPDVNDFHDGYWWPSNSSDAGTIAPLQIEKP